MKQVYFVAIPRCATHSVRAALRLPVEFNHWSTSSIRRRIGDGDWADAFTFTFIRHPVGRVVSWYFFHRNQPNPMYDLYRKFNSLYDWIKAGCPNHWEGRRGSLGVDVEANPLSLSDFLVRDGEIDVDFVGRVEHFKRDLHVVARRLGVKSVTVPHMNRSDWPQSLSRKIRREIHRRFREDYERFGYRL